MIKVFIVVLNWNRAKDTIECLESIAKLKTDKYDLHAVVVDNGSNSRTVEKIQECINSILSSNGIAYEMVRNKENLGFAQGNNIGIRHAMKKKADYVVVLNNDTLVDADFIIELLEVARKEPKVGAVSPKIYFAKGFEFHKERYKKSDLGKVIWYAGGKIDWDNVYGTNFGVDEPDNIKFGKIKETDFFTGSCVMFNTLALRKAGLFDDDYYMYFEDADLSMRMKKRGWTVLFAPKSKIWHKVSQSSAIGSDLNDYYITRNRLKFGMMYAPLKTKLALLRESIRFLLNGRFWQKIGVKDFYLGAYGKGSWK